jgi:hypothetical protein
MYVNYEDKSEELGVFEAAKAEAREDVKNLSLLDKVSLMKQYAAEKEKAEEALKVINAWYDVLRFEAIPTQMEDDGIENVRFEGIGRVSITGDLLVSTKGGAKDALVQWLGDHGLGDLVQEQVNASTLKAFVKRRIKEGKPYPEEYLNVTPITRASITKGK